jgi:cytochrome c553
MAGHGAAVASTEAVDQLTRTALALEVKPAHGRLRYEENCAPCHGATGQGDAARVIPALAGQRFRYLVRQLANLSGDQRDSMTMHRVLAGKGLDEPQTWVDIAGYVSRLPARRHATTGEGSELELGKAIYLEQCKSCHGAGARGGEDGFVPSLRAQHYPYLVAQISNLADGARHNVDEALVQFLRSFDSGEIRAVADYLSRLPTDPASAVPGKLPRVK